MRKKRGIASVFLKITLWTALHNIKRKEKGTEMCLSFSTNSLSPFPESKTELLTGRCSAQVICIKIYKKIWLDFPFTDH